MPFDLHTDCLIDEWKMFRAETLIGTDNGDLETFWKEVFEVKNVMNDTKYKEVTKVLKACLLLPHGNGDVEGFQHLDM